jgi:hypothetical protein
MIPYIPWPNDRFAVPFTIYTSGHVEIAFQYLKAYPPFAVQERRQDLLSRLNQIPGVSLPPDSFNRRPSFRLAVLTSAEALGTFTQLMEDVARQLAAARDELQPP